MISPIHFLHRQQERIFKRRAQRRQQLPLQLCCKRMFSRRYSIRSNPSVNCLQLVMTRRRRRRHHVTIPSWPAHPYWRRHLIIVIIRCTMVIQTRGIRSRARERDTRRKLRQSIYLFLSFGVFSPHRCVCIQSGFSFSVLVLSRQQKTTLARLLALCFLSSRTSSFSFSLSAIFPCFVRAMNSSSFDYYYFDRCDLLGWENASSKNYCLAVVLEWTNSSLLSFSLPLRFIFFSLKSESKHTQGILHHDCFVSLRSRFVIHLCVRWCSRFPCHSQRRLLYLWHDRLGFFSILQPGLTADFLNSLLMLGL